MKPVRLITLATVATVVLIQPTIAHAQTTDVVPKFTNSSGALGNSAITEVGGKVGISFASPSAKLDILGSTTVPVFVRSSDTASHIRFLTGESTSRGAIGYDSAGARFLNAALDTVNMAVLDGGSVGIGTASPGARFDVLGTNTVPAWIRSSDTAAHIRFLTSGGTSRGAFGYDSAGARFLDATLGRANMVVLDGGNVGIGTTTPQSALSVVGDVVVSGNISAKYQDVAEWVEVSTPLEDGTVVIIDPASPNQVVTSTKPYDTRVAGAVSAQPGLILGDKGPSKEMIAQSGRVRIKVDATQGAVNIGDLLVTSPTPGYAMRSRPIRLGDEEMHRPGTILGKALEALPSGKGEILVLLTLQ